MRVGLPAACAPARPSLRAPARAADGRGRRRRRGGHRGCRGARARLAARGRVPRPAQDAARQRRRPARAAHRPDQRLRAVSRLGGRPARKRGALRRARAWAGQPAVGLAGFLALTSILSLNFNAERLSRAAVAEPAAEDRPTAVLRRVYGILYAPQDRLAEAIVARRPALTSPAAVSLLANLGMSTQLAAFGLLIALGYPLVFAWVALAEVAVIALVLVTWRAPGRQEEIA